MVTWAACRNPSPHSKDRLRHAKTTSWHGENGGVATREPLRWIVGWYNLQSLRHPWNALGGSNTTSMATGHRRPAHHDSTGDTVFAPLPGAASGLQTPSCPGTRMSFDLAQPSGQVHLPANGSSGRFLELTQVRCWRGEKSEAECGVCMIDSWPTRAIGDERRRVLRDRRLLGHELLCVAKTSYR